MIRPIIPILCLTVAVAAAAPVPKEADAERLRRLYGAVDTPDTKARFDLLPGDRLRVSFPAARPHRALWFTTATGGARTRRDVAGDFTAVVRVSFPLTVAPDANPGQNHEAAAAGLLAVSEEGESVSVVRTLRSAAGGPAEWFMASRLTREREGGGNGHGSDPRDRPDAAFVRLVRNGGQVTAAFSRDGEEWTELGAYLVGWPDRVKLGVVADNGQAARFEATFDRYSVTQPKK